MMVLILGEDVECGLMLPIFFQMKKGAGLAFLFSASASASLTCFFEKPPLRSNFSFALSLFFFR